MDNYCEAGKVFLFNKLSIKRSFTMCSAEGSTHVHFQNDAVVYFFYKSLMLKSVSRNMGGGGHRIQSYFPSTVPGNAIASSHLQSYCHCKAAPRVRVKDTVTNLRLNRRTAWNISAVAKSGSTFTYFPSQGKTVKKKTHYSDCQRFLNYGHLTGRFAQTLGRRGLM